MSLNYLLSLKRKNGIFVTKICKYVIYESSKGSFYHRRKLANICHPAQQPACATDDISIFFLKLALPVFFWDGGWGGVRMVNSWQNWTIITKVDKRRVQKSPFSKPRLQRGGGSADIQWSTKLFSCPEQLNR